jgi:hypothetical protein
MRSTASCLLTRIAVRLSPRKSMRLREVVSAAWRQWRAGTKGVRAIAVLDDDDICHLSEAGQRLRQSARLQSRQLNP